MIGRGRLDMACYSGIVGGADDGDVAHSLHAYFPCLSTVPTNRI